MNVEGMLPFEDEVADYVDDTGNHVLYRVTPIFEDDDMVAIGVQMEAYSVEDDGRGVCFNVFCYNDQPGITIDYATGDSHRSGEGAGDAGSSDSKDANKIATEAERALVMLGHRTVRMQIKNKNMC